MEYTTEVLDKAVIDFIGMSDDKDRDFSEAYLNKRPYYFKKHHNITVPTEIINHYFGQRPWRMEKALVDALKKYGANRLSRQVYKNGELWGSQQVWVLGTKRAEEIIKGEVNEAE